MALRPNAIVRLAAWQPIEISGVQYVHLDFVCDDPGPGEPSDYDCVILRTDWEAAANNAARRALCQGKLDWKYRGSTVATNLNALIGNTFTVA